MNEKASVGAAFVSVALVVLACKSGTSNPSASSSSAAPSSTPTMPWLAQAQSAWREATIERRKLDAGDEHVSVLVDYTSPPVPSDIAAHVKALLAIDAPDRPCSFSVQGQDHEHYDAADTDGIYFIGHVVIEPSIAYGALSLRDVARRLVERDEKSKDSFACAVPTWMIVNTTAHFLRAWRAFVRDYSNVWDGSRKNALEAEKICEAAVDLDLLRGETFPDRSEAIENGVRFPQSSSQTMKWRSYTNYESSKDWFACAVNANEAPTITWDRPRP